MALAEVLASAKLNFTVGGTQTPALETEFAALYGVDHAVARSSGTAALHLSASRSPPTPTSLARCDCSRTRAGPATPASAHTCRRFPFTSPPARTEFNYGPGLCPRAERLIDQTLLVVQWNEAYTDSDVDEIAAAFDRVHAGLHG